MGDTWSFGGLDFATLGVKTTKIIGAGAIPPLRGKNVPLASLPGELWTPHQPGARRVALALTLADTLIGDEAATRALLQEMAGVFARPGLQNLVQHRWDGVDVTAQAQAVDFPPDDVSSVGLVFVGVADFELPDPYFYGDDVVLAATAIPASGTHVAITNPGDVRGHRIVFTLAGPFANPRITNNTNGNWLEVDVNTAAGQELVVDVGAFTAFNNGLTAIGSVRKNSVPWLFLEPGVNDLEVTGTAVGGTLAATFRPPHL
jgi:hypothetical protein